MFGYNRRMGSSPVVAAHERLTGAVDELSVACSPAANADDLLSVLMVAEGAARRLDQVVVAVVADLLRRGTFAERGYHNAVTAVADLMGWDRAEARRRVSAAEQVCPRTGLDGAALPARLPATAQQFATGAASLRHVEVITRVLAGPSAQRLSPTVVVGCRGRAGRPRRPVHAVGVAGVGQPTGRHAGPGRTRARRPPAGAGERGAAAALPRQARWHAEGAFRRRRDVRRDCRGGRRAGPSHRRRRPAHAGAAAGRSARRRVRVRTRSRRCARLRRTAPTPERARAAGGSGEPGPRRVPGLRRHAEPRVTADAVLRRRGRADRARRQGPTLGRRTGHPRDPRRAAAGGRRPRRRLRPVRPCSRRGARCTTWFPGSRVARHRWPTASWSAARAIG